MYVITYGTKGETPVVLSAMTDDEDRVRQICTNLAANGMDSVALHGLDAQGLIEPLGQWVRLDNREARSIPQTHVPAAIPAFQAPTLDEQTDDGETVDAELVDSEHDESEHTYNGYCVKCREKRDFYGEREVMENGRSAARGKCPVCGTGIYRILSNVEAHEWEDEESEEAANAESDNSEPEPVHELVRESSNKGTHLSCSAGDWDKWVTRKTEPAGKDEFEEHAAEFANEDELDSVGDDPGESGGLADLTDQVEDAIAESIETGTTATEVTAAVQAAAQEITVAVEEVEAAKPAKVTTPTNPMKAGGPAKKKTAQANLATKAAPAAKKATAKANGELPKEVAGFQKVAKCPQCGTKQPVQDKAGLTILVTHSAPGVDRCKGSLTIVND